MTVMRGRFHECRDREQVQKMATFIPEEALPDVEKIERHQAALIGRMRRWGGVNGIQSAIWSG